MKDHQMFMVDIHNNWSDAETRLPGPATDLQRVRVLKNQRLAQDIFDAAMLVKRAKNIKIE